MRAERYNCAGTLPTSSACGGSLDQVDDTLVEPGPVVEVGIDVPPRDTSAVGAGTAPSRPLPHRRSPPADAAALE